MLGLDVGARPGVRDEGHPGRAGPLVTVWSLGSAAGGLAFSLGRQRMPPRSADLLLLGALAATSLPLALALWQLGFLLVLFGLALALWLAVADRPLAMRAESSIHSMDPQFVH